MHSGFKSLALIGENHEEVYLHSRAIVHRRLSLILSSKYKKACSPSLSSVADGTAHQHN